MPLCRAPLTRAIYVTAQRAQSETKDPSLGDQLRPLPTLNTCNTYKQHFNLEATSLRNVLRRLSRPDAREINHPVFAAISTD